MFRLSLILIFIINCANTSKTVVIDQPKVNEECKIKDGIAYNPDFSAERFGVYFQGCFDKINSSESILSFVFSRLKGNINVTIGSDGSMRSNTNTPTFVEKANSLTSVKMNSITLVQTYSKDFTGDNYYIYSVSYTSNNKQPRIEIRDITFKEEAPERVILTSIAKNDFSKVKELIETGAINKDFLVTNHTGIEVNHSNLLLQAFYLNSNNEIIKYLISKKVNYDWKDKNGWTPLLFASMRNDFELFRYLYSLKKWNLNDVTDQNESALHWAVAKKNIPLIEFLIKNGIKKDIKNRFGQIAIDLAPKETDQEIRKLLE